MFTSISSNFEPFKLLLQTHLQIVIFIMYITIIFQYAKIALIIFFSTVLHRRKKNSCENFLNASSILLSERFSIFRAIFPSHARVSRGDAVTSTNV